MKKFISVFISVAFMFCLSASCGVDRSSSNLVGEAPALAGAWRIVLFPYPGSTDCLLQSKGFVIENPIDVPAVTQDGFNLSASFDLNGSTILLSGVAASNLANLVIEEFGVFMTSLGGVVQSPGLVGTFNGQELPSGCSEAGLFVAAIGTVETPVVTGQWTLTLSGTASGCDDPADEGAFEKVISNITVTSPAESVVSATYEDPALVTNNIGGIALGASFTGAIADTNMPPERTAIITGTIDDTAKTISGTLEGKLAFPGGVCEVSDGTFNVVYQ